MKKHLLILSVILLTGITAIAQTANTQVVTNLSAERFKAIITNDKNGIVLDLRTTEEIFSKGKIAGSFQLDYLAKDSEKQIDKLDKTKTYYVYCASGGRSADCAEYMEKHGFKRVYTLEKGFSDWASKGYAIEKK